MPILDIINTETSKLIFWEIEKNIQSDLSTYCLPLRDIEIIQNTKGEVRQQERLATRLCLQSIIDDYQGLDYFESGRPRLIAKEQQVSVSHSGDVVCVLLSNTKLIGVDIQFPSDKIRRVASRVFNQEELAWANEDLEKLTQLWCIKEAVFKASQLKGLDFRKEIVIDTTTFCTCVKKGTQSLLFAVELIKFRNYCVAYIL